MKIQNESERDNEETIIDIDAKVVTLIEPNVSLALQDNKFLVDQMIDAVVGKYTNPQISNVRHSPSPRHGELRRSIEDRTMFSTSNTLEQLPKQRSTGQFDEPSSASPSSPFKITDGDIDTRTTVQQPQITLKISRSSLDTDSPIVQSKKESKKTKSLKIVINKKLMLNDSTDGTQSPDQKPDGPKESTSVFDSDYFAEYEDKGDYAFATSSNPTDSEEPIIWKPNCNLNMATQASTVQASRIIQDNISLLDTISNDQDVVLNVKTEQHQTVHITSSVEEIIQVKKEIDETLQPVPLVHMDVANEVDEKTKHKKQKKDKKKKHKKEKHKHKHKSKDHEGDDKLHSGLNVVESQIKSEYLEDVKEEAVVFNEVPRPVPKLKLKFGGNSITDALPQSQADQQQSHPSIEPPSQQTSAKISPIPKILIKPIVKPKMAKKPKSPKKLSSLKIKLKLESNQVKDETMSQSSEAVFNYNESNDDEQLNTTVDTIVSNAVDVVNIDDEIGDDNDTQLNRLADQMDSKANRKRQRVSLTEEQIHSITDTINSVSFAVVDDESNSRTSTDARDTIDGVLDNNGKKQKMDEDVYKFHESDEAVTSKSVDEGGKKKKKEKKHKKKHKNRDGSPLSTADQMPIDDTNNSNSKRKKSSKKHRDRQTTASNVSTTLSCAHTVAEVPQPPQAPQHTTTSVLHDSIALSTLLSSMPVVIKTPQKNPSNQILTMSVTSEIYDEADKIWICPCCKLSDDGRPMIGCDSCDDWYHWNCVGINQEPPANQQWYCHKCGNTDDEAKRKKKKRKS